MVHVGCLCATGHRKTGGGGKYTDKFEFTLKAASSGGCQMTACSASQSNSVLDVRHAVTRLCYAVLPAMPAVRLNLFGLGRCATVCHGPHPSPRAPIGRLGQGWHPSMITCVHTVRVSPIVCNAFAAPSECMVMTRISFVCLLPMASHPETTQRTHS